jgi:class 3 adenylate cyclase/tetratricopeptide (TPR) repeat protein
VERKLATVLFVDLVASTDLVAGADPEIVRRRVTTFFDAVSASVVTHGGIVEKFAGDAVMAAFGVPLSHEDDAERGVRAALAILERIHEIGLEARIGVESGEVVADDSESTFATGEAVNVAARLQQEARPGDLLVGPGTDRLIRGLFDSEGVGPLDLRGFPEPIAAARILGTCPDGGAPALGTMAAPLVGRDEELELLETTFARTVRHGRTALFTVFGEPGVGKSRLGREFVAGLEGATVLMGRCLPYGEGVTYWSLAEMVRASAGIADDDPAEAAKQKLRECCEDEAVADLLALAAGVLEAVEGERAPQEISWAARAWAEQLAKAQPLVLLFEDIQWAEEPLLDLIEHLAAWVKDAPLFLLCLARPELLDVRPTWGGGRVRATAIELEALPPAESFELVTALLADRETIVDVNTVLAKSEGNPLFVEETVRMLVEGGGRDGGRIPDTLQALIAARIDRLPAEERTVIQRASVVGRVFWSSAIVQLCGDLDDPQRALDGLLLRDLIVRERRSSISGEEAYKFKHVLIREVAYAGLTKSARAAHHASFAEWIHGRNRDDLLEIRAFHLDQAARLHQELDGAAPPELARSAATALAKAGDRAMSREAYRTARKLHLRAAELAPTLENRYSAARASWRLGDYPAVAVEMEEVRAAAAGTNRKLEGRALTALADVALFQHADAIRAGELAERALETLEQGDVARFDAYWTRSNVASFLGDAVGFERAVKGALEVAQEAGRKDFEALATKALAQSYLVRLELDEAEPLVQRAAELADAGGSVWGRALAENARATLARMRGQLEESRDHRLAAIELFADLGFTSLEAFEKACLGATLHELGDLDGAERLIREGVRMLSGAKDRAHLCEAQRLLAEVLVAKGELAEAERFALAARETVGAEDRYSSATTKLAFGIVRSAQGRDDEAEMLLQDAADELRSYGLAAPERDALRALVQFLRDRGRDFEASAAEERLAELDARSTAPIA